VELPINRYLLQHPAMVLGTWSRHDRLYAGEGYTVRATGDLAPQLAAAIQRLPQGSYTAHLTAQAYPASPPPALPPLAPHLTEGSFFVTERQALMQIQQGTAVPVTHGTTALQADGTLLGRRLAALIALRDHARCVLQSQNEGWPEGQRQEARRALNRAYDRFVATYGPINKTTLSTTTDGTTIRRMPNLVMFRDDPDAMLVMALEHYDERTGLAEKAAILHHDVVGRHAPRTTVQSAEEGLLVSLDQRGVVDLPYIATLYAVPVRQIIAELGDLIYQDPDTQVWHTADVYLSGNVRAKLAAAERAGSAYARNVDALRAVQPEDVLPGEIDAHLGAPWIPECDIQAFAAHLFSAPLADITVVHLTHEALWSLDAGITTTRSVAATTEYGTARANGVGLLEQALNLKSPTIYDVFERDGKEERVLNQEETLAARDKQKGIKERFRAWIFADPDRTERLVRFYNETYNNLRLRRFDGSHLVFPGMSPHITLSLHQRHPGHGVTFATATPVSNTLVELYTLQRYLDPDGLAARGIDHFDAWAATFGEVVDAMEISPDGKTLRPRSRFAHIVNKPELQQMFRLYADVQTAEMLHLPRPRLAGGKATIIACPMAAEQSAIQESLVSRYDAIRSGTVKPWEDNALAITTDGRKLALDARLLSPTACDDPGSKINALVANVTAIWQRTTLRRGTQLVFCDLGVTPTVWGYAVYAEVIAKLVGNGIPRTQIAAMGEADTDAKKQVLFERVRAGAIRVVLGSTQKMGPGTNVQQRLIALHHLDAPWKPAEIEQRDGRILRQGNTNAEVTICRYVTQGSFDAYMWQAIETKARAFNRFLSGEDTGRRSDDVDSQELSYAEVKAIASGNPAVLTLAEADATLHRLYVLWKHHADEQYLARCQVRALPAEITRLERRLAALTQDSATAAAHAAEPVTIGRRLYSRYDAIEALAARLQALPALVVETRTVPLGVYRGLHCGLVQHPHGASESRHMFPMLPPRQAWTADNAIYVNKRPFVDEGRTVYLDHFWQMVTRLVRAMA
jgi:N12 class adenine-specific DNA methylase